MRCLLRGHQWRRIGDLLVCADCYKRRPVFRTRRTTTGRFLERGAVELVELLLWSALVGMVGGFLFAFVAHAQRVQDDCAGLEPPVQITCIRNGHTP